MVSCAFQKKSGEVCKFIGFSKKGNQETAQNDSIHTVNWKKPLFRVFHKSQALSRISSIKSSLARRRWIAGLSTSPELVREATQGFTSMDVGWILALAERFDIFFVL